jgi:hypothetical protein
VRAFAILLAAVIWAAGARAAENGSPGNDFLAYCTDPVSPDRAMLGFVIGFESGTALALVGEPRAWCVPKGTTWGQISRVVCQYLRDHPSETHEEMVFLAARALTKAWPRSPDTCPNRR